MKVRIPRLFNSLGNIKLTTVKVVRLYENINPDIPLAVLLFETPDRRQAAVYMDETEWKSLRNAVDAKFSVANSVHPNETTLPSTPEKECAAILPLTDEILCSLDVVDGRFVHQSSTLLLHGS